MRSVEPAGFALAAATIFALLLASMPNARAGNDGGELVAPAQSVEFRQQEALRTNPGAAPSAIGGVALIKGRASVTRGAAASTLKVSDAIFRGDVLQTAADGTLGVTFNDATTFSLLPNSQITVDNFVYQERGKHNVAAFGVIKGTVSFVASAVAKTGDMRIDTPSAAIGIRGTAGIIETGAASEVRIKLYPDADGHVGRIEVFGRDGSQLGVLTGGATGFLVRAGAPAVPLQISQQEIERDRSFLRQTFSAQQTGRRINLQRQNLLRQNRQLPPSPRPGSPPNRLNLLPPTNRSVGPTLLQPGTAPRRSQPDLPEPSPDNTVPPVTPPVQPLQPPPGLPSPAPNLPPVPAIPGLPGRL
jgi:hypothetical protein